MEEVERRIGRIAQGDTYGQGLVIRDGEFRPNFLRVTDEFISRDGIKALVFRRQHERLAECPQIIGGPEVIDGGAGQIDDGGGLEKSGFRMAPGIRRNMVLLLQDGQVLAEQGHIVGGVIPPLFPVHGPPIGLSGVPLFSMTQVRGFDSFQSCSGRYVNMPGLGVHPAGGVTGQTDDFPDGFRADGLRREITHRMARFHDICKFHILIMTGSCRRVEGDFRLHPVFYSLWVEFCGCIKAENLSGRWA